MGREVIQGSLTTRVRISPLILLVARSGVGKSSFLTCRLIPNLGETSAIRYRNEWGGAAPDMLIDQELEAIQRASNGLPEKPLLVLDQFEDVFKLPNPREALWDKLAELVNVPDSPASILISMREEWLGAWEESADYLPGGLNTLVRLAPLTAEELTRAILRPPQIEGTVSVEAELVTELLQDLRRPTAFGLGESYVEPGLLQLVCHRLWNEASATRERRMTLELYNKLGRADRISRDFVWNELGHAGASGSHFTTFDRVLWVGMTRHLVVAQGIKAITDPTAMAKKMRMEDLGFAGPAITHARLPKDNRAYLTQMPERRGEPPEALVTWISDVVEKGVQVGFLKQQHGLPSAEGGTAEVPKLKNLFEISHDALSEMFQQFSVEFESWVRERWAKLVGALFGGLVVLPVVIYLVAVYGFLEALGIFFAFLIGGALYIVLVWLMIVVAEFFFRVLGYPIIRRLAQGVVPLPSTDRKPPSALREKITRAARRLGFLPR
jgi:hypothetical protein